MVAEPVEKIDTPVTEVSPETSPAPVEQPEVVEDEIPEEAVTDFLKEQKLIEGDQDSAAKSPETEDEVDLSTLTPQQILDLGKQKGKSEVQTEAQSRAAETQRLNRVNGARSRVMGMRDQYVNWVASLGYDASGVRNEFDQLYGLFNVVLENDVQDARNSALQNFQNQTIELALQNLGAKGKDLTTRWGDLPDEEKSSAKFFSLYAEEARKGYLSQSDVDKLMAQKFKTFIAKLPKEARDAIGFNPPSATVKGGTGTSGPLTEDKAKSMPVSELKKLMADKAGR